MKTSGSALQNWTSGNFVNGTKNPRGGPSLFGANFQAITFAQSTAGYLGANGTPNATLEAAFQATDVRLGAFINYLKKCGQLDSTLLLVGSKQGQGPIDPKTLNEFDPQVVSDGAGVPVTYFVGLDGGIVSHRLHSMISPSLTQGRCTSRTLRMLRPRRPICSKTRLWASLTFSLVTKFNKLALAPLTSIPASQTCKWSFLPLPLRC